MLSTFLCVGHWYSLASCRSLASEHVVLTVRNGEIARLRDYVNILAAAAAMGSDM